MTRVEELAIDQLRELIGGDDEMLLELIQTFYEEGEKYIEQLQQGEEQKDFELMGRTAHTLKSSAADFGATPLSELCSHLERQCREKHIVNATEHILQIKQEFEAVRVILQKRA